MSVKERSLGTTHPCPHCASPAQFAFRSRDENQRVSDTYFAYFRCPTCRLIFIAEAPADLDLYYPMEYYALPDNKQRLELVASKERFKLDLIRPYQAGGDLLEIGSAWGSFAYAAKSAGYNVEAVEIDEACCRYLREVVGVTVHQADASVGLPSGLGQYDVVALWQVIEHLQNFEQVLTQLATVVRRDGIMAIAAPNPASWQFRVMGERWPHVDAPRHLQLIPAQVIIDILAAHGFEVMLLTCTDPGGLSWNRFGWQRLIINTLPKMRAATALGLAGGAAIAAVVSRIETRDLLGATYTLVLRKSSVKQGSKHQREPAATRRA